MLKNISLDNLEAEANNLLLELKQEPKNYRELANEYYRIRSIIRYRTNPKVREYKRNYYLKKKENAI
jgi:hypothetical protein